MLFLILAEELDGTRFDMAVDDRRMYPGKCDLGDVGRFVPVGPLARLLWLMVLDMVIVSIFLEEKVRVLLLQEVSSGHHQILQILCTGLHLAWL